MKKLVIFGAENFAAISHYYFTHDSEYTVAGFTVDRDYVLEEAFQGLPVVPFDEVDRHFPPAEYDMFVAVGIRELNRFRARKVDEAQRKGYRLASYLSSRAIVPPGLSLGPNTMVMESVIVHPHVTIGQNTIVWPNSQLSFFGRVGDHCWLVCITTGEAFAIGDYTFAGLRAVIAPFVKIGRANVLGAGALLLESTSDSAVYRGHGSKASRVPSSKVEKLLQ